MGILAMTNLTLTEKHYSFIIEKDVIDICEPLKQYGINLFDYVRIFNDGTIFMLTNMWQAYYHQYKKQYEFSRRLRKIF
jgi:hypothetical protein